MPFRELAGALIVDPAGDVPPDRIFVITEWTSLTPAELGAIFAADVASEAFAALRPRLTFVINGLSWPATERLTYRARRPGTRGAMINLQLSDTPHASARLLLHRANALATGTRDEPGRSRRGPPRRHRSHALGRHDDDGVGHRSEEGNWLFHCHIMFHVTPDRGLAAVAAGAHGPHGGGHGDDRALGMAGMVLGVTVLPAADGRASPARGAPHDAAPSASHPSPRRVTLEMRPMTHGRGEAPAAGFTLLEAGTDTTPVSAPGPPLMLRLGEPIEITVTNRLETPTSLHWHGIELPSLYDGVHGWSGRGAAVAPMIAPGTSFIVRFTPRRTGTFIYHTHVHDYRQLTSGLYGAIVVLAPGDTFDPSTDHVIVLGRDSAADTASIVEDSMSTVINGERSPRFTWRAGDGASSAVGEHHAG